MIQKTILVRALSAAFSAAALTVAVAPAAFAQSNAAGNVFGRVEAPAGATVVLNNVETGYRRSITLDNNGRYNATAMPPGRYKVELVRDGKVEKTTEVEVLVGQGTDASFVAAGIQAVQVTGRRSRIDVSNSNNGATFTAKELAKLPIATNVDAIIQLAPNTTRADSRYAAGASFGGGGASENAYYINGFPVTNPLTQLGGSELPFGAIAQAQVLTGGFGAEFGRSVGGVLNVTTKSGTNTWEAGAKWEYEPNRLRAEAKDVYYPNTGAPENKATDNTIFRRNSNSTVTGRTYSTYVGGPIIKDTLFMFAAIERKETDRGNVNRYNSTLGIPSSPSLARTGWEDRQDSSNRYLAKFDWNITDNHRLELTLLGDDNKQDRQLYGYNYATGQKSAQQSSSEHYRNNSNYTPVGADSQILRYTGNITEDLTITALYGQSKTKVENTYDGDLSSQYQITAASRAQYPGLNYTTSQVLSGTIFPNDAKNDTSSGRMDLEYKIGNHQIRAGFDNNKLKSIAAGDVNAGGGVWFYDFNANTTTAVSLGGVPTVLGSYPGLAQQGYFVSRRLFDSSTNAYSDQTAQYIEDRWQVTKDVLVTVGLRNEGFKNKNGDGETFLEVKNFKSPRLAATWDVNGDASLKVFGSAGRYALQIPTHLAVRGASRSLNTREYFSYTGTDANGNPTGLVAMTPVVSTNNEYGQAKDVNTLTSVDIKPTYQDEITLGLEKVLTPSLNVGAKVTYRKLKETIDDYCDDRAVVAWAERNNVSLDNFHGLGCVTFNPGKDNTFRVDFEGNKQYTLVNLSAAELGFEKAKRTYSALDLFAEHPLRNGWYGRVNYTWSRSRGNTEGQTRSDNAQTDVAATSTWDTQELMYGAYGPLPNDRKHQVKAFGYYEVTPEWSVGGNFLAASGRPRSCFGNYPNLPDDAPDYGSVYFWCGDSAAPRGSRGNLPWDIRLDANVAYRPAFAPGLAVKVDVFNVTNKQVAQNVDETYNLTGTTINSIYERVISYTAPRSARLTIEYNKRF
ncbi:TonB-dependent receptor [Pseudoduganella albidiflava]|uniref:Oar protein n=1 Tax=Pseudoduganella albidiflava TaxID=321983 RepID=A0A411X384_9BURK|nr:TonB-dependent receptor [Pseudoduganella albidiflava]QBI03358.1 TonB-dependent receptor [Pseudoduganella albidiflava]GGY66769.1 Oar protein [Pseudoduganella albidiflava]